jgi:arsenate reductase (glutaredoxin)
MSIIVHGIKNCDTVKKALAWLDQHGVAYQFHDYKTKGADAASLGRWCDEWGWERVLNRAGTTFRKLPEPDREGLDRAKAIALMLAQPSMIKRPIIEGGKIRLIGFDAKAYEAAFGGESVE